MTEPTPYTSEQTLQLACELAECRPDDLLATHLREDGTLVVVIRPGPKIVYAAQQVAAAAERLAFQIGQIADDIFRSPLQNPPAAPAAADEDAGTIAAAGEIGQLDLPAISGEGSPGNTSSTAAESDERSKPAPRSRPSKAKKA